jgi:hypothetical protein
MQSPTLLKVMNLQPQLTKAQQQILSYRSPKGKTMRMKEEMWIRAMT